MRTAGSAAGVHAHRTRSHAPAGLAVLVLLAGLSVGGPAGCGSNNSTASASGEQPVTTASQDKAKLEAKRAAERRYNASVGRDRDAAALAIGLICNDMGDTRGAREWLSPLVGNADQQIAGRAQATLGLMAQQRGDHPLAIELLRAASEKLSGDDAVQARLAAARSLDSMGRAQEAKAEYARASVMGGYTGVLASDTGSSTTTTGASPAPTSTANSYSIQVGAFSSKANADKQAAMIRAAATRAGLGMPWIEPQVNSAGRSLYAVRVGKFGSRAAAADARGRAGLSGIIAAVE